MNAGAGIDIGVGIEVHSFIDPLLRRWFMISIQVLINYKIHFIECCNTMIDTSIILWIYLINIYFVLVLHFVGLFNR